VRGFTLLELLVVVAIGSILLSIGIPAFTTIVASQRSTTTTNDLVESMLLARSEAIKRGLYVSVCRSANGSTCNGTSWDDGWIVFSNVSGDTPAVVNTGDVLIKAFGEVPDTISITPSGNIGAFVSFRPVGTTGTKALNFAGTLTLCDNNDNTGPRGLIVSPSGSVGSSRENDHAGSALGCP